MTGSSRGSFEILGRRVHPPLHRIEAAAGAAQLEPKAMGVLVALADRAGEVVSHDELFDAVWPGTHVTRHVLTRCIADLRRAFDDDSEHPQVIETIRGGGYRLIAPVKPLAASVTRRPPARVAAGAGLALLALAFLWPRTPGDVPSPHARVARRLTSGTGLEIAPALARDGRRIVFSRRVSEVWRLYVAPLRAGALASEPEPFFGNPPAGASDSGASWSPDGSTLAFNRRRGDECGVWLASRDGSGGRRLTPSHCGLRLHDAASWAADGRSLAFVGRHDGGTAIFGIGLEDPEPRPLTTPPYGFSDGSPSYSANGRWLAFVRSDPLDAAHVHRIDLASGEEIRLSRSSGHLAGLAAEDAGTVLVAAARTGSFGLWRYRSGAAPVDMIAPGWKIHRPQVSATGAIAYETWFYDSNIWRIPPGGEGERLVASSQFDLFPDASREGRIVFTSNRAGSHALWIREPDGREWQRTRFPVPASTRARWSPDGRAIAVASSHEGQPDLYVLDPDDRDAPPRRLTDDTHAERAVSWTADGSLLFASQRTGEWQVWRIEPRPDARAQQVTRGGAFAAQEHAGALYFTRRGAPGLWKLDNGLEHQVLADLPADSWRDWCVDAEGIHYYRGDLDEGGAILTLSPESGRERIAARTGSLATTGLSRLPDGSFVVTRVERSEADIMLLAVGAEP